ncbi:MAG: hypothetical protein ACP5SH_26055, partial [Syntrophobacteraceae bacterium]
CAATGLIKPLQDAGLQAGKRKNAYAIPAPDFNGDIGRYVSKRPLTPGAPCSSKFAFTLYD